MNEENADGPGSPPARPRPGRWILILGFAIIYFVWGSTYLAMKFGLETLPPFSMAGTRFLLAGMILYVACRLYSVPAPKAHHWKPALVLGLLMPLMGNGGVVWAQQYIPSGLAALLVAMTPLWIALLLWARPGGVRPTGLVSASLFLGVGGMIGLVGKDVVTGGGIHLGGVAAVLLASFCWSVGTLYTRQARMPKSPMMGAAMQMLTGGAMLWAVGLLHGEAARIDPSQITARSLWAVAYLVGIGSLVGFTTYAWLLRVVHPTLVSTYAFVNPVVAVALGCWLAGETLSLRSALSGAVILSAVALLVTSQARERPVPAPAPIQSSRPPSLCTAGAEE